MTRPRPVGCSLGTGRWPLLLTIAGCGAPASDVDAGPRLRPVRTVLVSDDRGASTRSFAGQAQASASSRLSFRVGGLVQKLPVNVGDRVAKGDLVAEVDPTDLRLQVQEAQAALVQVRSQARNAQASYERTRTLYENQNASRQDLDATRAAAESGEAQLRSLSRSQALLRRQLDYATLTAPVAGTIATVDVELNENVRPGEVVATLLSGDDLEVSVAVPEVLINRVTRGMDVVVSFDAVGELELPGVVSEVGVATGASTTFPVIVRLPEPDPAVRAGMAAEVTFAFAARLGDRDGVGFRLPTHAVGEDRNGRFVYVVEADADDPGRGTVRRRGVEIGAIDTDGVEIVDGLSAGQEVVTAGLARVRDGLPVARPRAGSEPNPGSQPNPVGASPADDAPVPDKPADVPSADEG